MLTSKTKAETPQKSSEKLPYYSLRHVSRMIILMVIMVTISRTFSVRYLSVVAISIGSRIFFSVCLDIIFGQEVPRGVGDKTIDIPALKQLGDVEARKLAAALKV
jgi:hypothetical protein